MLRSPARGAMVAPSRGHAISAWSLRDHFTRSAEFARKVFQLRQAIAHRQHGFRVVDVHARFEIKLWNRGGEDVDQAERRVSAHQMTAAFRAILPLAEIGFLEHRNVFGAGRDPHRLRLPEAERVDRPAGTTNGRSGSDNSPWPPADR